MLFARLWMLVYTHKRANELPLSISPERTTMSQLISSPSHTIGSMKALLIGPDKDLLTVGSVSHARHAEYARYVEELHAIVFARRTFGNARVTIAENAWSYPTGSRNTLMLLVDAYRLGRRILRERGEWVLSAQDPFESGLVVYLLARVTGTPFLIQEHGDFFSERYWREESWLNRVRYVVGRWIVRRASHVRVVCERTKRTLGALGVPRERMSVVPVFTDTQRFQNATPDETIRTLAPPDGALVLSTARFVPQKNLPLLVRACIRLWKEGEHIRLVVVGRGPLHDSLLALTQSLVRSAPVSVSIDEPVVFRDWTDDPAGVIKAADLYALSSNYEGWGRVCIEALAAGVPLLMTDVGCAGDVVHDGVNGRVVPVNDEERFVNALRELVRDRSLRDRLVRAGAASILTLPSTTESVRAYIRTLEQCVV